MLFLQKNINYTNMDTISTTSEERVNAATLNETLGFKVSGTRNFLFSVFNRKTSYRSLLFGGAMPIHKTSDYIMKFYDEYLQNGNDTDVYHFSVILDTKNILKETESLILITLNPSHKISDRTNNIANSRIKMTFIFNNIYDSFIDRETDRRFSKEYRTNVGFTEFKDARNRYNIIKASLKNKYGIKQVNVEA